MWNCYLLQSETGATYVGITEDLDRRLRQHNGAIAGGAAATAGHSWIRLCHVRGFPNQRAALQFEWAWKNRSKKQRGNPLERRLRALQALLSDARPTALADPYDTYPTPLEVVWETTADIPTL